MVHITSHEHLLVFNISADVSAGGTGCGGAGCGDTVLDGTKRYIVIYINMYAVFTKNSTNVVW